MASKNPGKQRRTSSKAAMHVQRKRLRARLVSDDPQLQMIRTVTVRAGDEVEVEVPGVGLLRNTVVDE